jgi:uncharacterized protein YndB with AHSA1/START domain
MMMPIHSAQVDLPSDREVRVQRSFKAPRTLVYEAYTKPQLLTRWMLGPPGWSMTVCEMDMRPGGAFTWRWRSDAEGKEFGFFGEFREVEPPARIVHTEHYDPGDVGGPMPAGEPAIITVELVEHDGFTTVTTTMLFPTKEDRDGAVASGMTDGMELSYQLLDNLLVEAA